MKKEIKIQSTVYPQERQMHPIITAVNNADRRKAFNCFNEELLNRILDIKKELFVY